MGGDRTRTMKILINSDRKIQKLISKDIKSIRTLNRDLKIGEIAIKILEYYNERNYSENILFGRRSKLKTEFIFLDNIYSGSIGAFIGLMFSSFNALRSFNEFENLMVFFVSVIFIIIYLVIIVLVLAGALTFITKFSYRKDRMYDDYFNLKELEIIEKILEV